MEAEFVFISRQQALDIGPVLPDDQSSQAKGQYNDRRLGVAVPADKGEAGSGPQGAEGNVPGQGSQNQEAAPDNNGDAPVDHDGDGAAGKDALASLKVEHTGEHVAQQAEKASPVFEENQKQGLIFHRCIRHNPGIKISAEPYRNLNRGNCFQNIA